MIKANIEGEAKFLGEITGRWYDQTTLTLLEHLWNKLVIRLNLDKKRWYILGKLKKTETIKNIICTIGLNVFARLLASDNTYSGNITRCALGVGTGSFDGTETALYNESYRNTTASYTSQDNIAYVTAYYTETEVDGNFTEFGNFIDATQLWTHVSITWNKSDTEVLVVDQKYTLTSA